MPSCAAVNYVVPGDCNFLVCGRDGAYLKLSKKIFFAQYFRKVLFVVMRHKVALAFENLN